MRVFIGLIVVVLAIVVAIPIGEAIQERNRHTTTINRLDEQQRAWDAEQQRALDVATFAGRVSSDYGLRIILFGAIVLSAMYLVDSHRRRQVRIDADRRLVYPDQAGRLPVARAALEERQIESAVLRALEMWHVGEIEQKRTPLPPVTYSPHLTYHNESTSTAAAAAAQIPAPVVSVPTFSALLAEGKIGPDSTGRLQPLILGYGTDGAVTGDWRSLYSCGLGGLQGSGKTWAAVFLLAQSALSGAKLVICDPHAGDDNESLARRVAVLAPSFLCDIADDDTSIMAALKLADDTLQQRKRGDKSREPVIVVIDEWLALRRGRLADVLPRFVETFSTEGRKLNCHAMLLTQRADKEAIGDFRNTLASSYVFRLRADEARMLTGLRAASLPDDTLQLAPGESYLLDTRGTLTRVKIPLMTQADVGTVARYLVTDDQPTMPRVVSHESVTDQSRISHGVASDYSAVGRAEPPTPEAARVVSLFLAGKDAGAIVQAVWGLTSKAGNPYMRRLAEVQAVIRAALASQGA